MKKMLYLLLVATMPCYGQTSFGQSYSDFKNQAQKEYEDFRAKANKEYVDFMLKAWKSYESTAPQPRPIEKEVPPVVIQEKEKKKPIKSQPVLIDEIIVPPAPLPQPQPISPIPVEPMPVVKPNVEPIKAQPRPVVVDPIAKEAPKPVNPVVIKDNRSKDMFAFYLYGTPMHVRLTDKQKFTLTDVSNQAIANQWAKLATAEYDALVKDCLDNRANYKLSDWAYLRMIDQISDDFLGKDTNESELLKAFIFAQSGYKMRLVTQNDHLYMMFGTKHMIYERPYLTFEGVYYYGDDFRAGSMKVCNFSFPQETALSLYIPQTQELWDDPSDYREITSSDRPSLKATSQVNKNSLSFFEEYPTSSIGDNPVTRWAMIANTPTSEAMKEVLYPELQELIKGKTPYEATDLLCHWIQTGFKYEYDDKVWGHDRAFFADETLYYPYCDCEDRSILLTRMVRDLLGLKCALVYYPGHLATAIAVGDDAPGDYIAINGTKYLVCDPTYIGAKIGRTMPKMDNQSAKVIVLD